MKNTQKGIDLNEKRERESSLKHNIWNGKHEMWTSALKNRMVRNKRYFLKKLIIAKTVEKINFHDKTEGTSSYSQCINKWDVFNIHFATFYSLLLYFSFLRWIFPIHCVSGGWCGCVNNWTASNSGPEDNFAYLELNNLLDAPMWSWHVVMSLNFWMMWVGSALFANVDCTGRIQYGILIPWKKSYDLMTNSRV